MQDLPKRALGKDIIELFGFDPEDDSDEAKRTTGSHVCALTHTQCIKQFHDGTTSGVCTVSNGSSHEPGTEVIICPKRLYAEGYKCLRDIVACTWSGDHQLIIEGSISELSSKAKSVSNPVVAFGQGSGREISIRAEKVRMSLDWVLQSYEAKNGLQPVNFVGVEVQSIDITNNYRDNWQAYMAQRQGSWISMVPDSQHGLNWANVHKRLLPQIIRKGNIYKNCSRCIGFFFVVPDVVFLRFEDILPGVRFVSGPSRETVSILTYGLGPLVTAGRIRELVLRRTVHIDFNSLKEAFSAGFDAATSIELDSVLISVLT